MRYDKGVLTGLLITENVLEVMDFMRNFVWDIKS